MMTKGLAYIRSILCRLMITTAILCSWTSRQWQQGPQHSTKLSEHYTKSVLPGIAVLAYCLVLTTYGGGGGGAPALPTASGSTSLVDTDGNGLTDSDEINIYYISPVLADIDGDGFSGGEEVNKLGFDPGNNNNQFNTLIADIPRLSVAVTSEPDIQLNYTETNGASVTKGISYSNNSTSTLTTSLVTSNGVKIEDTNQLGTDVLLQDGKPVPKVSYCYTDVTTQENMSTWSQTEVDTHRQDYASAVQYTNTHDIATSGGLLSYSVQIKNTGRVAFTLSNLTLYTTHRSVRRGRKS